MITTVARKLIRAVQARALATIRLFAMQLISATWLERAMHRPGNVTILPKPMALFVAMVMRVPAQIHAWREHVQEATLSVAPPPTNATALERATHRPDSVLIQTKPTEPRAVIRAPVPPKASARMELVRPADYSTAMITILAPSIAAKRQVVHMLLLPTAVFAVMGMLVRLVMLVKLACASAEQQLYALQLINAIPPEYAIP
jgi:hypothetical protein